VFPGYVLVQMELTDESWSAVKNTPGVTGFVGAANKPVALSRAEVDRILHTASVERPSRKPSSRWAKSCASLGSAVRLLGEVSEVNADQNKLKVMVSIFAAKRPSSWASSRSRKPADSSDS